MDIRTVASVEAVPPASVVIVVYFAGEQVEPPILEWIQSLNLAGFDGAGDRNEIKGTLYSTALFRGNPSVLLVGLGKRQDFVAIRYLRAIEAAVRFLAPRGYRQLAVVLPSMLETGLAARTAVEAVIRGAYDEGLLKTQERESTGVDQVTLVGKQIPISAVERGRIVGESANFARDLLNLPPNDLTPSILAERVTAMAQETGLAVRVLDETAMAGLHMGAILAVAKGSSEPPRVIDIRYGEETAPAKLALVGKGLTFDSGGLSLKTAAGMEWMKGDMGGAAAVAGALRAIALLKPANICVRGIIGSVENMPGPAAMKPGDVLRTMNGKTIEVLNTDAEGRLVLSDVLAYAVSMGATHIVDLATLTGSAVVALGNEAAALIGRPQAWVDQVRAAAGTALERLWQLPLYPEYRQQMKSDIADIKNTGGRAGGALTASSLLAEFVGDVPWAHLDIAGTAWVETKTAYAPTGGTGYGVATLAELALAVSGGSPSGAI